MQIFQNWSQYLRRYTETLNMDEILSAVCLNCWGRCGIISAMNTGLKELGTAPDMRGLKTDKFSKVLM